MASEERSKLSQGYRAGTEREGEREKRERLAQVIVWLPGDEGFYAINSVCLSLLTVCQVFNKGLLLISELILSRSTSATTAGAWTRHRQIGMD